MNQNHRASIDLRRGEEFTPCEIHADPAQFAPYWTVPGDIAMRYVVGIGRPGLYEAGEFYIGAKMNGQVGLPRRT